MLIAIGIFVMIQYFTVEKIARPFLLGLGLYFFLMAACNLIQGYEYFVNPSAYELIIYDNYFTISLIFIAPLVLIFQIEKTYFPERKSLSKFHLVSLIILILVIIFFALTIPLAVSDPLFLDNFRMADYGVLTYISWGLIVIFICGAFLYFGIKSSGKYRLYSLIIFLGWGVNQLINAAGQLTGQFAINIDITIIFIIKIVAAVVTAFGFVKLYALRNK